MQIGGDSRTAPRDASKDLVRVAVLLFVVFLAAALIAYARVVGAW
jgi:hypothetical protein